MSYRPGPVSTVPTHGDWHPRNWLLDGNAVRIIDFGRFEFRPPVSDFCRLDARTWRGRPELEKAFLRGYGSNPREEPLWSMTLLREAIGTAVWAYQVGDETFEAQGHRMLTESLDHFSSRLPLASGLSDDYSAAWDEWAETDDAQLWDATSGDGA